MSRLDEVQAELAYLEVEDEFLKAKEKFQAGKLSFAKYSEVKDRHHAARVAFREARTSEGTVNPGPVTASASVKG